MSRCKRPSKPSASGNPITWGSILDKTMTDFIWRVIQAAICLTVLYLLALGTHQLVDNWPKMW